MRDSLVLDTQKKITEGAIKEFSSLRIYPPNTLLIALYGATIGKIGLLGVEATTNQACCALVNPRNLSPKFGFYCLLGSRVWMISLAYGGGQPNISQGIVKDFKLPLPSLAEQRNIVTFLEHETAQIDTLIAKQERLIAILQEKRQTLISHAVTKGLNPDAPMKDSGVEWLGEIPNSWKMIPFGYLLERIETGWTPTSEQRLAEDDEWAVLKVGCIRNGKFYQDEHKALASSVEPDPTLEVHPGDLLMSRANTLELAGSVGLIETTRSRLTLSDKTFRLILKADLLPSYANQLLQSRVARNQIELSATGASQSMKNISQSSVRALLLPIPPLAEQSSIIDHLRLEMQKIDLLVAKAERAIGLLQERRTALISAAVTGKIDVRAAMN